VSSAKVGNNGLMWKRVGVFAVWILATLGTASITLAAVSRVGGEVTERPAVPVAGADLATTTIQPSPSEAPGITAPPGTVAVEPGAVVASTSASISTSPSAAPPVSSSLSTSPSSTVAGPSATSSTSTTTTTSAAPQPPVSTALVGGTVTVQRSGSSVTLISAVPASGFTADIEKAGPSKVEVEFKSENHESQFQAEVSSGVLEIDTEEHAEGGD